MLDTWIGESDRTGAVTFESVYFDTSWVREWKNRDGGRGTPGPGGVLLAQPSVVVDMRLAGPLTLRDNFIGHGYSYTAAGALEPIEEIVLCARSPQGIVQDADDTSFDSFVFEGNALMSCAEDPFELVVRAHPWDEPDDGDWCVYPTTQASNIVARTWNDDRTDVLWQVMPQHHSTLASEDQAYSVLERDHSHEYYELEGTSKQVSCLEDGTAGQIVVLHGTQTPGTDVAMALGRSLWFLTPSACRNIRLSALGTQLEARDTLVLIKGEDQYWYEVSRSDN